MTNSDRVGQRNLGGATGGGGAPGDLVVDGGGGGAGGRGASCAATTQEGVQIGEEPEDPGGADEEEGGGRVPRLREARYEHVDHEDDAACGHAQEEHGEDQRHPHVSLLIILH